MVSLENKALQMSEISLKESVMVVTLNILRFILYFIITYIDKFMAIYFVKFV